MGQQHQTAAGRTFYPFGQILRRVASALTESRRSLYLSGGRYLPGTAGKKLLEGLKTGKNEKITK